MHALQFVVIQGVVPLEELVADLDFPRNGLNITLKEYYFKGIL
jgi:hypothetical protein